MKLALSIFTLLTALSTLATIPQHIICREDNRLNKGSLQEVILTPTPDGYLLQSQSVQSLNSPDIKIDNWAADLACRMDEKVPLAYCKNAANNIVLVKERREVFFDSLEVDDKKKTTKYIDISFSENGVQQKILSFPASHCQILGGEA